MGCNCGRNRPKPTPNPAPTPQDKKSGQAQTFTLETNGKTMTFGSRLEAEAARVRLGSGVVRRG